MERNWFSNFIEFETPMKYDSMVFMCPETFYVAMKTRDKTLRQKIAGMKPGEAKRFGRTLVLRPDWNDIKIKVMAYALKYKFAPGTGWYKKLMETREDIVEWNCWHDNLWGNCVCDRCKGRKHENMLGKLLMEIRGF